MMRRPPPPTRRLTRIGAATTLGFSLACLGLGQDGEACVDGLERCDGDVAQRCVGEVWNDWTHCGECVMTDGRADCRVDDTDDTDDTHDTGDTGDSDTDTDEWY